MKASVARLVDRRANSLQAGEIVKQALAHHVVIRECCPLECSIEWQLGQRYWRERGNGAFLADRRGVPYIINNDGALSRHAGKLLFSTLAESDDEENLSSRLFTLELGVGVGLFARYLLDTFRDQCAERCKDYYERLWHVAGDRSPRMLLDTCRHGVLADHTGRYRLQAVDALNPECEERGLRAVFLNYLLGCLPTAVLQIQRTEVRQLHVRTCLARGADIGQYTDLAIEDLVREAGSSDAGNQHGLMDCFPILASEYDYRAVDPSMIRYGEFAVEQARKCGGEFVHSFGAIQCLERLLDLIDQSGFILINDYGSDKIVADGEFEHQRFSNSTAVGVNFALLKSYFAESGKCQWVADPQVGMVQNRRYLDNNSLVGPQYLTKR